MAEADTEAVAEAVPMEVEAEAASTVAAVVADSMEAAGVMAAEHIAAEAVVRTAADRRVALLAAWVRTGAAVACTVAVARTARTAVDD